MNTKIKDGLAIVLIIIVIAELLVYNSELSFTYANTYTITLLNVIFCIGFLFWYTKKIGVRILITLVTIAFGLLILFFEFIRDFSQTERIHNSWNINNYEIIYANQEYFAGPGSEAYLKLNRKYIFGIFTKNIDEVGLSSTYFKLGSTDCTIAFPKSGIEFNLCERIQIK